MTHITDQSVRFARFWRLATGGVAALVGLGAVVTSVAPAPQPSRSPLPRRAPVRAPIEHLTAVYLADDVVENLDGWLIPPPALAFLASRPCVSSQTFTV